VSLTGHETALSFQEKTEESIAANLLGELIALPHYAELWVC